MIKNKKDTFVKYCFMICIVILILLDIKRYHDIKFVTELVLDMVDLDKKIVDQILICDRHRLKIANILKEHIDD